MTPIATIFIPFAPYHSHLVKRAFASAVNQTVECEVVIGLSEGTPAKLRNEALKAESDLVVMLDADDLLDKRFVEACLGAYEQGHYVYTSWYEGDTIHKPKSCAWSGNSHHIVTTLYPTELFKYFGGFDERLPAHEDADFYMRSYAHGVCGIHLDEPLVTRPEDSGQRSKDFHVRADYESILKDVAERNGGMARIMSACCGGEGIPVLADPGAAQPGDVLAEALWSGNRSEYSPHSGRLYIGGNNSLLNVAAVDVDKLRDTQGRPLFRLVKDLRKMAPERARVLKESGLT